MGEGIEVVAEQFAAPDEASGEFQPTPPPGKKLAMEAKLCDC